MDMIQKKLLKSGLSQKEAAIYSYLVTHGGGYPSAIASSTKLNRTTVYSLLGKMSMQGMVSEIEKGSKKYFQIEKPERLVNAAQYKVKLAEESCKHAELMVPILTEILNQASHKPKVQFYNTYESVIAAYMQHVEVKAGYEMKAFFSPIDLKNFLPPKKFKEYIKLKETLGITVRAIASESKYLDTFSHDMFMGIKKNIWPNIRIVPGQIFPFPGEITLYDHKKVSIIKFDTVNPVAVVIDDQNMYNMIQSIFELVWSQGHPISKGKKSLKKNNL
jgi:predicted transcriptional regulator